MQKKNQKQKFLKTKNEIKKINLLYRLILTFQGYKFHFCKRIQIPDYYKFDFEDYNYPAEFNYKVHLFYGYFIYKKKMILLRCN